LVLAVRVVAEQVVGMADMVEQRLLELQTQEVVEAALGMLRHQQQQVVLE